MDARLAGELIEAAAQQKPGLVHLDYNLGRAEMLLGNAAAAASHFERSVRTDTDPQVAEQAWYQLGTAYRRLHRTEEARTAMAKYQELKDQEEHKAQKSLQDYQAEHPDRSAPPPPSQSPQ